MGHDTTAVSIRGFKSHNGRQALHDSSCRGVTCVYVYTALNQHRPVLRHKLRLVIMFEESTRRVFLGRENTRYFTSPGPERFVYALSAEHIRPQIGVNRKRSSEQPRFTERFPSKVRERLRPGPLSLVNSTRYRDQFLMRRGRRSERFREERVFFSSGIYCCTVAYVNIVVQTPRRHTESHWNVLIFRYSVLIN